MAATTTEATATAEAATDGKLEAAMAPITPPPPSPEWDPPTTKVGREEPGHPGVRHVPYFFWGEPPPKLRRL